MSFKEFLLRWFNHAACALAVWLLLALMLEILIPGSVTPFVDLVDLVGVVLAVGLVALVAAAKIGPIRPIGPIGPIFRALLTLSAGALGAFFLWSRFTAPGALQLALCAALVGTLLLACWALFVRRPTSATMG